MKFLLLGFSLFLASPKWLTFETVVGTGVKCYDTTHRIEVLTLNNLCPRKDLVEHETTRLLKRLSAPQFALAGAVVTISPVKLNSTPTGNYGEVEPGTSRVVVMQMPGFMQFVFVWNHELAHVLIDRIGEDIGDLHVAYSQGACAFDLEACLLLPAVTNVITDEPQLPVDNRFRKKWTKLTKKRINQIQKEDKEVRNGAQ